MKGNVMTQFIFLACILLSTIFGYDPATATTVSVSPSPDIYTAIESAATGDVVELAPGTYQVRLYLDTPGVTVRAADPANKPVFDFTGQDCNQWPGSVSDWKASYGIVIQANDVVLENVIVKGARVAGVTGSGIYVGPLGTVKEPATPGTMPENVTIRGCEITDCDDGINSCGVNVLVEDCEVHGNGDKAVGALSGDHNFYVQGGSIAVRNCNIYHALSGQNFNTRAQDTLIENCILGDMASYPILVSTPKATATNGVDHIQTVTIRNCQISGIRHNGLGLSKFMEVANASNYAGLSQYVVLENNVVTGADGGAASIIYLHRYSGTKALGVKSTGNTYRNFGKFLRLNSGEVATDPVYAIDVQDWQDDSLPAGTGGTPPSSYPQVKLALSWEQEVVPTLKQWNVYVSKVANSFSANPTAQIAYTAGMEKSATITVDVTASTLYLMLKAVDIYGQTSGESNTATVETAGLPAAPPAPVNFSVRIIE